MRKITLIKILGAFVIGSISLMSCEKDDPVIPNEEELITTLRYVLTPEGGGDDIVLSFQDLDGDGGNDPIVNTDTITAGTNFSGRIEVLNEAENPVEDITLEVIDEGTEHQFFFQSSLNDLVVTYDDQDADNNPLGVETSVTSGMAGNGTLTIILRHEPTKTAEGVANGDITNAGGETDIQVTFDIVVQ